MNSGQNGIEEKILTLEVWAERCGWAVVFGLALEVVLALGVSDSASVNKWGGVGVDAIITLGVAGEVLFSRKARALSGELQRRSEEKVAEANRSAAEAQLKLAQYRAGRQIEPEQWEELISAMNEFMFWRVILGTSPEGHESVRLTHQLWHLFQFSQLMVEMPDPAEIKRCFGFTKGVLVWYVSHGSEGERFARTMVEALGKIGIFASIQPGLDRHMPEGPPDTPRIFDGKNVAVIVGERI